MPAARVDEVYLELQRERLLSGMFGIRRPAPQMGHYALLGELGRGGMGVVYEAYDRKLDRRVAIKLLDASVQGQAAVRLGREAQGLAKLSHPNVVQVYEIGEHEGAQFLVMEFVVGQTLRAWLARVDTEGEPVADVRTRLETLVQAGRGLAAAHAAGLVHRDFKPENVIVGDDGRARVLDFGLVRGLAGRDMARTPVPAPDELLATDDELASGDTLDAHTALATERGPPRADLLRHVLTQTGAILGTPAYMAPEQLRGQPCGPLADQFAFCVVAFEAVYGRRPFVGRNLAALRKAVCAGLVEAPPREPGVPARVHAAISRGLAVEPSERWPDMEALLDELEAALKPRRRRLLGWIAGAALGASLAGAGAWAAIDPTPELCTFEAGERERVWSEGHREALREALAARELGDPGPALATIDEAMTRWTARWLDSKRRNCEATHVRGNQSEELLDLRETCLALRAREAEQVAAALIHPGGAALGYAPELLASLPDIEACDDPRLAETAHPLPEQDREAIEAAYAELARVQTLGITGERDTAEALLDSLESRAGQLDYLPLSLELQVLDAKLSLHHDSPVEAVARARAAIRALELAGLDERSASARTDLATTAVGWWGRPEQQLELLYEAETAVLRVGRADDPRQRALALARARWQAESGDTDAALARVRELLAEAEARGDLDTRQAASKILARLLAARGEPDEAEKAFVEAQQLFERQWGPYARGSGELEFDLAVLDLERGRLPEAEAHLARARAMLEPLLGPHASSRAELEGIAARLAFERGDLEASARHHEWVIAHATSPLNRADAWNGVGVLRFFQADLSGSIEAYRQAQTSYLAVREPDHPDLALVASNLGESLAASGDHLGALELFAEAIDIYERRLPADHLDFAFPYKGRGQSRFAQGDLAGARADLEWALRLHERHPGDAIERADVEFSLARVLHDQGQPGPALELAAAAARRYRTHGLDEYAVRVEAWQHDHEHEGDRP